MEWKIEVLLDEQMSQNPPIISCGLVFSARGAWSLRIPWPRPEPHAGLALPDSAIPIRQGTRPPTTKRTLVTMHTTKSFSVIPYDATVLASSRTLAARPFPRRQVGFPKVSSRKFGVVCVSASVSPPQKTNWQKGRGKRLPAWISFWDSGAYPLSFCTSALRSAT
jgi:hypothetical protein